MKTFNIIELLKLLRRVVYIFLIFIIIKIGVYHKGMDILEKVVTPSEERIEYKHHEAEVVRYVTTLNLKYPEQTNIEIITRKYNKYKYVADTVRKRRYDPFNPHSLKTLRQIYKQTKVQPESLVVQFKLKLLDADRTASRLAWRRQIAIEKLKANGYCKQFYIKNYPEVFNAQHKFDSVPATANEWFPVFKSFIIGSKIPNLLDYYYHVCVEPFVFNWVFQLIFWFFLSGSAFWITGDYQGTFDFVNEQGFGKKSPSVIPFSTWGSILNIFRFLFPNAFHFFYRVYIDTCLTFIPENTSELKYFIRGLPDEFLGEYLIEETE